MGGVDWPMVRSRYAALLPRASTRAEVSDILQEMLAELGKSHVSESPAESGPRPAPELMPGCLGADFAWDAAALGYRCTHIVCGDRWDAVRGGALAKPGVNVSVGDVLCRINGIALTESTPPAKALLGCAGQEIALAWRVGVDAQSSVDEIAGAMAALFLNDKHSTAAASAQRESGAGTPAPEQSSSAKKKKKKKGGGARDEPPQQPQAGAREHCVTVRALAGDRYARYVDEVACRRMHVHSSSEGRIGYIHLPDCERLGFAEFHRHYLIECRRDGLVLDVRGNGGGHISDLILEKLSQKIYGWEVPRCGQPYCVPSMAAPPAIVLLCDESTSSDGELLVHRFQTAGLGAVVGTRTWGGVMNAGESDPLIDTGSVGFPSATVFAVEPTAGTVSQLENRGAVPDIEVVIPPHMARLRRDAQLEAAVEHAMRLLEKVPTEKVPAEIGWRMEPRIAEPMADPSSWPFSSEAAAGGGSGGRQR